ncbi:fibronectin type III domain-containing protein [Paenibacillus mesophilus]|uniref:fibronectin type III domain-containing protein n=1 Tax=Paenibacillus mesophilus TaxID=2582849 RepID=UPI00110F3B19|nr:fibronectin type III domain-containing protein [Paenibacillus mesophilus]TMV50646.1 fibronectin type III domain-containing protein [Paenibacillus mesophilus]
MNVWLQYYTDSNTYENDELVQVGGGAQYECTTESGVYENGGTWSHTTCRTVWSEPIYETRKVEYTDYYRGSYIGTVTAPAGTYPVDGQASDGYWYVLSPGDPPALTILSPQPNQMLGQPGMDFLLKISVTDPDGDTLVSRYFLDGETVPRDSRTISNTETAQVVAFNAIGFDELTDGDHMLKVEVTDNETAPVIQTVAFRVDKSPPVMGNIQASSTETTISVSGTATDSGAGMAAEPYRYTVGTMASSWTADTYLIPNLTPDTGYDVKVEARDSMGHIATKQQTVYTKAQTPAAAVFQSTESSLGIRLTDSNPSTTSYQIKVGDRFVSTGGSLATTPTWITPANKHILVNGLTANTAYPIQAMAANQEGTATSWSGTVVGTTTAAPPTIAVSSRTQSAITISWPATSGATGYDIEVDGAVVPNGTAASYTHSGLSPESRHTYRVRVHNAGGGSGWSQPLTVFTLPNPPGTPAGLAGNSTQTAVTLVWEAAAKADGYELEVDGHTVGVGNQMTYTHSGLQPETAHTYRVRAINIGGASVWSTPLAMTTLPYPPETPGQLRADLSIHTVTVHWAEAARAAAYEIEVDDLIVDNGTSTTYVHEGLEPLSGHTYRVRATNAGGKSAWSAPLDVTTHPEKPAIPTNLMATSDETTITIMWYQVLHADSYEVEIDGQIVPSGAETRYVHSGLAEGTPHTYKVRAKNISGYSEWSGAIAISTLPAEQHSFSLTNMAAIVTNTTITFSWDTVARDAEYDIEVDGVLQNIGKETIYYHAGLTANEFHTYKVRVRIGGVDGGWVAIMSLSTLPNPPDAPKELKAIASDRLIELRWERVDGASGYDLEIDGSKVGIDGGTNYVHRNLAPGTSHTYRLRAKNVTGVTAWSPAVVKSTTNPAYVVQAERDQPFDLMLFAHNVQDFWEKMFVVTYDPDAVEIVDLYDFTPALETGSGSIAGSLLTVAVTPGRIEYMVSRNIVPGTSWSGEITTIKFKAKQDGQTVLNATME